MKRIYESDNWTIDIDDEDDLIRITSFKDNHYVDDIALKREDFLEGRLNIVRELLYE